MVLLGTIVLVAIWLAFVLLVDPDGMLREARASGTRRIVSARGKMASGVSLDKREQETTF